ncbi:MAG: ketoacyl-ACP synthase III [Silvanigrellaceae bacterium]|nr:ketoacyl-ACP synthase III [Silvanigrellaceae bacterium]
MKIKKISAYFPEKIVTTEMLFRDMPERYLEKILNVTGIYQRHVSNENEYVSDLAVAAAEKLFISDINRNDVDYIILCTQTADNQAPTTACIIQARLKLKSSIGAIDVNLGCSGYIYALSLAYGLLKSKQAKMILVITADTYTKYLNKNDTMTQALFGDAATATLIQNSDNAQNESYFLFGTDGEGAKNLIVKNSGAQALCLNQYSPPYLYMDGAEIMSFALRIVPEMYMRLLSESKVDKNKIKYFIFHQANKKLLSLLKNKLSISEEKFVIDLSKTGNTISSTIPIALCNLMNAKKLKEEDTILLLGFGIGYSWAGCIINSHLER